ncbi:MAG: hypothetical protein AB1576_07805 [Bacillota bacterium]
MRLHDGNPADVLRSDGIRRASVFPSIPGPGGRVCVNAFDAGQHKPL